MSSNEPLRVTQTSKDRYSSMGSAIKIKTTDDLTNSHYNEEEYQQLGIGESVRMSNY